MFNLKEHDDKQKDKELVSDLYPFITGKETSFKCTRLGSIKSTSIRPAKIEFTNPLIKNNFMRNLNKLKGAPTEFKNVRSNMTWLQKKDRKRDNCIWKLKN